MSCMMKILEGENTSMMKKRISKICGMIAMMLISQLCLSNPPADVIRITERAPLGKTMYCKFYRPELQFDTIFIAQIYQYLCDSTSDNPLLFESKHKGKQMNVYIGFTIENDNEYLLEISCDVHPTVRSIGFCEYRNCRFWIAEEYPSDYFQARSDTTYLFESEVDLFCIVDPTYYYFEYHPNERRLLKISFWDYWDKQGIKGGIL